MLEHHLVMHCSPTLAGIKTGNLFNFTFTSHEDLILQVNGISKKLGSKGICIEVLRIKDSRALILVYRPKKMAVDLKKDGVTDFLKGCGYASTSVDYAVSRLKERLRNTGTFSHEIGLFLGYLLDDVIGFIQNQGRNWKCIGYWKVYTNVCKTRKLFKQYKQCTGIYSKLFADGYSIMQLIVVAQNNKITGKRQFNE